MDLVFMGPGLDAQAGMTGRVGTARHCHADLPALSAPTSRIFLVSEIPMRADVEASKADIEQSIELLRRRL